MLPSIPALACAVTVAAEGAPRYLRQAYGAAVLYAFFVAFPVRFLP
jgi:hypothetical protein